MPNDLPDADASKVRSLTPASVFPSFCPYFLDLYTLLPRSPPGKLCPPKGLVN